MKVEGKEFLCVFDSTSDKNCVTTNVPALISTHSGKPRPLKVNGRPNSATFGEATILLELDGTEENGDGGGAGKLMTASVVDHIGPTPVSSSPKAQPIDKNKFPEVDVLVGEPQMRMWHCNLDIAENKMIWHDEPQQFYGHLDKQRQKKHGFMSRYAQDVDYDDDPDAAFEAMLLETNPDKEVSEDEAIRSDDDSGGDDGGGGDAADGRGKRVGTERKNGKGTGNGKVKGGRKAEIEKREAKSKDGTKRMNGTSGSGRSASRTGSAGDKEDGRKSSASNRGTSSRNASSRSGAGNLRTKTPDSASRSGGTSSRNATSRSGPGRKSKRG